MSKDEWKTGLYAFVAALVVFLLFFAVVSVAKAQLEAVSESPVDVKPVDEREEVDRAVENWKLMESATLDANKAYDDTISYATVNKDWWDTITELLGISPDPVEQATTAYEEVIAERTALKEETYDIDQATLVLVTHDVPTYTYTQTVFSPCPTEQNASNQCAEDVQQQAYDTIPDYYLVVTPTTTHKVSLDEYCYEIDGQVVCENQYRCDMKPGLELGCEPRTFDNNLNTFVDDINAPLNIGKNDKTTQDMVIA